VDVKQDHLAIQLAIMSEEPNETQKDITTPECKKMVTTEPSQLLATNAIIPRQTSWSLLGRSRYQKSRVRSSCPRRIRLIKTNVRFAPRLAPGWLQRLQDRANGWMN
jgi:hypothetical protein